MFRNACFRAVRWCGKGDGEMKKILLLVILAATFLVGYELGRSPDSPDIIGWLKAKTGQAYVVGRDAVAAVSEKTKSMAGSEESSQ